VTKLSAEHVISASALRAAFGDPIRNVAGAELFGGKKFLDHEQVIKDVCQKCNSKLSPLDVEGSRLVQHLTGDDPTGLRLPINREAIGWILKTHFNFIRLIKDRETGDAYPIHPALRDALVTNAALPTHLFTLCLEGMIGDNYFWDASDARRIPWFHYRSVRFLNQEIVLSEFRMKTLTTWLLLPSSANYVSYLDRVGSVLKEGAEDFQRFVQVVDVNASLRDGHIDLSCVVPIEVTKSSISRA
jgi:hypothetical protein